MEKDTAIMKPWLCNLLILLAAWICVGAGIAHTDLGDDKAYRVPLIGDYAVYRDDGTFG